MIARGQDKTLKTTLNLVRVEGFEPPRPKTVEPKSTAAANFAILAFILFYNLVRQERLELSHFSVLGFESSVSAIPPSAQNS
jgi:hypothetical protein